ncbi:DUF3387 domain-containing protein [Halopseudomonas pachastrellae]|nr:DUF3387 domain-containing protein [Halopseudomonas pachastrellae]
MVDDKVRYTDWNQRENIKAELKVDLILLLAKHGYPPVDRMKCIKKSSSKRKITRHTEHPCPPPCSC